MTVDLVHDALVWRTGRFEMRPLQATDAAGLMAHLGDAQVTAFMDIPPLSSISEAMEIINWSQARRNANAGVRWSIRPRAGGGLVGTCGYNQIQAGAAGEIAYDVARPHWGERVMDEVMPPMLGFGFRRLALGRITALVTFGNDHSCRLLERHGFAQESLLRESGSWKGRYWDQHLYARASDAH